MPLVPSASTIRRDHLYVDPRHFLARDECPEFIEARPAGRGFDPVGRKGVLTWTVDGKQAGRWARFSCFPAQLIFLNFSFLKIEISKITVLRRESLGAGGQS
jgi:hypothetical protein